MGNFLAFDLGASSGRAIIGSLENGKLSLQEIHRFGNGPVEKDGSFYWDYNKLKDELITGIGKALALNIKLDSISIDTWGVDYVLFDRDTKEMRRMPYNYRDPRTIKVAEDPALDETTLVEFAEFLDAEVSSGAYTGEEKEIFLDCLAVCAGVYDEKFAK